MQALYEEHRPKSLDEIVGQAKAVRTIRGLADRAPATSYGHYPGLVGRVFWITGVSGTGKTSLARIIARMVCEQYAIEELDAADLGIDRIREIESECRIRPIGCLARSYIINEAHTLRGAILARLNTTLETPAVSKNSTWCFTTTLDGEKKLFTDEIETIPFSSRTIQIRLGDPDVIPTAQHLQRVAQSHNLDGQPLAEYVKLLRSNHGNIRQCLQDIDAGIFLR